MRETVPWELRLLSRARSLVNVTEFGLDPGVQIVGGEWWVHAPVRRLAKSGRYISCVVERCLGAGG